jgi:hypothetical protein
MVDLLTRPQLRELTLEALRRGIHHPDGMREFIATKVGVSFDWRLTNLHAWALVDLQGSGQIEKRGRREYALI